MPTEGRIGRYELTRRIGNGAFAVVWEARDDALDITVAIKVLADNWSLDEGVRERFLSEAKILRRVSSPRVVRVHDIGETDGKPYFVMDHVAGGTVADLVATGVEPVEGLRLAAETAYAVHDLHLAGVAHRDVKPTNLLVDRTGAQPRVLVTDLGTAKALAEGSGFTVTAGTPAYMAPEQVHGDTGIDERADVYGIGVVAYELLTGRKPFEVDQLLEVRTRATDLRPAPVAAALGLPARTDTLLASALARSRDDRPVDARALGEALTALVDEAAGRGTAPQDEPGGWSGRAVTLVSALAFLFSGLVTAGIIRVLG